MSSGATNRVVCPKCQAPLKVMSFAPGEKLNCPKCQTTFLAPQAAGSTALPSQPVAAATPAPPAARPTNEVSLPQQAAGSAAVPETIPFDSLSDDDFRLADPVPRPAAASPSFPQASLADQYDFSFPCPICRTSLDCHSSAIGQTTKCPDCDSTIPVPRPDPSQIRRAGQAMEGSMNLSEAVQRPIESTMAVNEPFRANASQLLAKAQQELAEEEQKEKRAVGDKDLRRVFLFFSSPQTWFRAIVLSIGATVVLYLGVNAGQLLLEDGKSTMMGFFLGMPTAVIAVYWLSLLCASGLAVLNGTGSGDGREVDWPDFSPFELLLQSIYVINSLFYSLMPAALLGLLAGTQLSWDTGLLSAVAVGLLGLVAIFPIVLLSTLHEGSLFAPVSSEILSSMKRGTSYWITFYQAAVVLAFLSAVAFAILRTFLAAGSIVVGPSVVLIALLYFRLLGWLAWRCQDVMSDAAEDEDDAE